MKAGVIASATNMLYAAIVVVLWEERHKCEGIVLAGVRVRHRDITVGDICDIDSTMVRVVSNAEVL